MLSNTNNAQVAFLGMSENIRGCRNVPIPLDRVALLLWAAVGVNLTWPAPHNSASPTGTRDVGTSDEKMVIGKFLFSSDGLWISWHEALHRLAVV